MKKIVSFLGTGRYEEIIYSYDGVQLKTPYIQELVHKIVGKDSLFIIGLTSYARERNWERLKSIFDEYNVNYKTIDMLEGKNKSEVWKNFDKIFDEFEEKDEIYFDITHSFRSLPFVVMSVINYARFTKDIDMKEIFYGAYEARETVNGETVAPLFNLSAFTSITDWTMSADKFITTGATDKLEESIDRVTRPVLQGKNGEEKAHAIKIKNLKDKLKRFSDALYTVRGSDISRYGVELKDDLMRLKSQTGSGGGGTGVLEEAMPLLKISDKMLSRVEHYTGDLVEDMNHSAKMCHDLNLIQQGFTILQENIISHVIEKYNTENNPPIDMDNRGGERFRAGMAISTLRASGNGKIREDCVETRDKIKKYVTNETSELYNDISNYRNDLSHAGFKEDRIKAEKFKSALKSHIARFEEIISKGRNENNL